MLFRSDGTGALHIVDITDPAHPKQLATWKTPRADAGGMLHDVDVQDGLLYGSWWNDGLVILDVGNGIKNGTPSNPQFVTQYKYDLDALYKDVEAEGGKGFIRGTHTAWRYKDYVIIADEVFGNTAAEALFSGGISRAHGRLQVLDVKDIEQFEKHLVAQGLKFEAPPRQVPNTQTKVAFLTDPWGTYIEVTEHLAP